MTCGACQVTIPESMAPMLERLVSRGLDPERKATLATMYGGEAPTVLCWGCFVVTVQVLNGIQEVAA